jgi:hypothetical protein
MRADRTDDGGEVVRHRRRARRQPAKLRCPRADFRLPVRPVRYTLPLADRRIPGDPPVVSDPVLLPETCEPLAWTAG